MGERQRVDRTRTEAEERARMEMVRGWRIWRTNTPTNLGPITEAGLDIGKDPVARLFFYNEPIRNPLELQRKELILGVLESMPLMLDSLSRMAGGGMAVSDCQEFAQRALISAGLMFDTEKRGGSNG